MCNEILEQICKDFILEQMKKNGSDKKETEIEEEKEGKNK